MLDRIKISLQYLLPRQGLTCLAGWVANQQAGWFTQLIIKAFARYYKVNMQEAENAEFSSYDSFNAFFTRPLRSEVRPVVNKPNSSLALPTDGEISQLGTIHEGKLLQAKGHNYSLEALLAGNYQLAAEFQDGLFITTYLAPGDYHRVHMPCKGVLREMIYVPGDLFSVNALTAANVPNLFARNERVISIFNTAHGPMAQILVGATIVGSIETDWGSTITPPRKGIIQRWTYPPEESKEAIILEKGQEMGRFKLGSTVINLFAPGKVCLATHLESGTVVRTGELLAQAISTKTM